MKIRRQDVKKQMQTALAGNHIVTDVHIEALCNMLEALIHTSNDSMRKRTLAEYNGAVSFMLDVDMITFDQYDSLVDVSIDFYESLR